MLNQRAARNLRSMSSGAADKLVPTTGNARLLQAHDQNTDFDCDAKSRYYSWQLNPDCDSGQLCWNKRSEVSRSRHGMPIYKRLQGSDSRRGWWNTTGSLFCNHRTNLRRKNLSLQFKSVKSYRLRWPPAACGRVQLASQRPHYSGSLQGHPHLSAPWLFVD